MLGVLEKVKQEAKKLPKVIVLPETEDERILKAAEVVANEKIAIPILVGKKSQAKENARKFGVNLEQVEIIEVEAFNKLSKYASLYAEKRKTSERLAYSILKRPLCFSCMMVAAGDANGMVAGASHTSSEVIAAAELIVGLQSDIRIPSSCMLLEIPHYDGGEDGSLIFADVSVNPDPAPECLCNIAIASARSAKDIFGWEPRVAMLSFSTKGSAMHPLVDKVIEATNLVKKGFPDLLIDGELQADAALDPEVAKRKIKNENSLEGKANVLIFPNLDAANIGYKLVQRIAKANAYGPILQGFAKPISDLSRGASTEDIVGTIAMLVVQAQKWSNK